MPRDTDQLDVPHRAPCPFQWAGANETVASRNKTQDEQFYEARAIGSPPLIQEELCFFT